MWWLIVWLLVGLVAGALARLLVPGRDPMGVGGTLLLGLVGSLIGGFVATWIASGDPELAPAGLIGATLGAIAALLLWRAMRTRRHHGVLR